MPLTVNVDKDKRLAENKTNAAKQSGQSVFGVYWAEQLRVKALAPCRIILSKTELKLKWSELEAHPRCRC